MLIKEYEFYASFSFHLILFKMSKWYSYSKYMHLRLLDYINITFLHLSIPTIMA